MLASNKRGDELTIATADPASAGSGQSRSSSRLELLVDWVVVERPDKKLQKARQADQQNVSGNPWALASSQELRLTTSVKDTEGKDNVVALPKVESAPVVRSFCARYGRLQYTHPSLHFEPTNTVPRSPFRLSTASCARLPSPPIAIRGQAGFAHLQGDLAPGHLRRNAISARRPHEMGSALIASSTFDISTACLTLFGRS